MRMRIVGLVLAAALFTASPAPASQAKARAVPAVCLNISTEVGVACASYIGYAHGLLEPYYKEVSSGKLRNKIITKFLSTGYSANALKTIQDWATQYGQPIDEWPSGSNDVPKGPTITIIRAVPHPKCNKIVLVTRETWIVIGSNTKILYAEHDQIHTVVLGGPSQIFKVLAVAKGKNLKLAC